MARRPTKIRSLRKAPRAPGRLSALLLALAWVAAGAGLMFGLSQLPNRLDTVLFFSTALRTLLQYQWTVDGVNATQPVSVPVPCLRNLLLLLFNRRTIPFHLYLRRLVTQMFL